jgi:D-amino-acid dehydrogenase
MGPASAAVRSRAVVVGGGFVGLATALHLQRAGKHVTLLEAGPDVGGRHSASNGNAGTFAFYANVPVQRPGLWKEAPGMIMSRKGALRLVPDPHLLRMVPWAAGALASCSPAEVRKTSLALGTLLRLAEDGYRDAWSYAGVDVDAPMGVYAPTPESRADAFAARKGYILLQRDVTSASSAAAAALRREGLGPGLKMEALDGVGVRELEPLLSDRAVRGGAWWFEDGWFLRHPEALLSRDARRLRFARRRGSVRGRRLRAFRQRLGCPRGSSVRGQGDHLGRRSSRRGHSGHRRRRALQTPRRAVRRRRPARHRARVQRAVGAEKKNVFETDAREEPLLTRPVCSSEGGFIVTPMSGGVRSAGLVELGGLNAGPVASRFEQLDAETRALFSFRSTKNEDSFAWLGARDGEKDWLGFRPTLPDALPVLGPSSRVPGVLYAFGHQHIGWTLGGITGRVVADLATGKTPEVDLAPFSARRFRGKPWWPYS